MQVPYPSATDPSCPSMQEQHTTVDGLTTQNLWVSDDAAGARFLSSGARVGGLSLGL